MIPFLVFWFAQAVCMVSGKRLYVSSRIKESVVVPSKWRQLDPVDDRTTIHLHIGIKQSRFEDLEKRLYEVSSPSHSDYGHHLSKEEATTLVRSSPKSFQLTQEWLFENGIFQFNHTDGQDWITTSLPVRHAERLLDCQYHEFENVEDGQRLIRTLEWSMPNHLEGHVDIIQPTNSFFGSVPQGRYGSLPPPDWEVEGRVPTYDELVDEDLLTHDHFEVPSLADLQPHSSPIDACNRLAVSPLCLRVLYGTLEYKVQSAHKNKMGVVNFLGHNTNRSDIAAYLARFRPDAAAAGAAHAFETVLLGGATDQQTPNTEEQLERRMGIEGALDVETLLGVGWPTPLISWNVGGQPPFKPSVNKVKNSNEPYIEWLNHLLAQEDLPPVISVSYADEEQTVPPSYARRVCAAFAQLGARGVSVIVASGDNGVGPEGEGKCRSNDGGDEVRFMPTFPASCPYVTAVGGTRHFDPVMVGFDARGNFVAGGGFSDYFGRPSYQDSDVKPYIDGLGETYQGLYNPRGRGIPDVSAHAYHYSVIWNGTSPLLDGTSASAPTFAAIVALINDALLAEERPPLGFLNPWIYSSARSGFRDVTVGSNRGCGTLGFAAGEGWDAATGLGTPWFPALKDMALQRAFRMQRPWYMDYP